MAKKKEKKQGGRQVFLSPEAFVRQRMRQLPIGKCYINDMVDSSGLCHIIVTREHTGGRVSAAMFLVDMWCTGVKEAFYRLRLEPEEMEELLFRDHDMIAFHEISYAEAHNRIYGAIAYAEDAGLQPDKSFQLAQYFLEEDTDDVPMMEFDYGKDGEYFLVCESQLEASRYLPTLRRTLGEDGFKYIVGVFDHDDDDDDDDERILISDDPVTVADLVADMDIYDLQSCADLLGIDIDDTQPEAVQRRVYAKAVVENPRLVLDHLCEEDLQRLNELNEMPQWGDYMPYFDSGTDTLMADYGLAEQGWKEDSSLYAIHMATDFLKAVKPLLGDYMKDFEPATKFRHKMEMVTEGLANLYGSVTRRQVVDFVNENLQSRAGREIVDDIFEHAWASSMLIDKMAQASVDDDPKKKMESENVVFMSRYGWCEHQLQQRVMGRQSSHVKSYRNFTMDEVADAARGGVPLICNPKQAELEKFLTETLGLDELLIMVICHNLWFYQQHLGDPDYPDDKTPEAFFEEAVLNNSSKHLTQAQHDEGMQLMYDYLDHMPQWSLKGFSRVEKPKEPTK